MNALGFHYSRVFHTLPFCLVLIVNGCCFGEPCAEGRGQRRWSQRDAHEWLRRTFGAGHKAASILRFQPYSLIAAGRIESLADVLSWGTSLSVALFHIFSRGTIGRRRNVLVPRQCEKTPSIFAANPLSMQSLVLSLAEILYARRGCVDHYLTTPEATRACVEPAS